LQKKVERQGRWWESMNMVIGIDQPWNKWGSGNMITLVHFTPKILNTMEHFKFCNLHMKMKWMFENILKTIWKHLWNEANHEVFVISWNVTNPYIRGFKFSQEKSWVFPLPPIATTCQIWPLFDLLSSHTNSKWNCLLVICA
jgi:hypothetical protein